jgi:hypothetical protein
MTKKDNAPNPTLINYTLPSITVTIRGGRKELEPGWPLDQILEIEQARVDEQERSRRKKGYLK